jgi:hypothetical protein
MTKSHWLMISCVTGALSIAACSTSTNGTTGS